MDFYFKRKFMYMPNGLIDLWYNLHFNFNKMKFPSNIYFHMIVIIYNGTLYNEKDRGLYKIKMEKKWYKKYIPFVNGY